MGRLERCALLTDKDSEEISEDLNAIYLRLLYKLKKWLQRFYAYNTLSVPSYVFLPTGLCTESHAI